MHLELARKVNLALVDKSGNTRLHKAICLNTEGAIALLARAASTTDRKTVTQSRNKAGNTALHLTVLHDKPIAFRNLINAKANVTAKDRRGLTPLQLAARLGRDKVLDQAVRMGLDVRSQDDNGMTLTADAVFFGQATSLLALGRSADDTASLSNLYDNVSVPSMAMQAQWKFTSIASTPTVSPRDRYFLGKRPKIRINQTCKFCDLERWIEGSRTGEKFWVPYEDLSAGRSAGCNLCNWMRSEYLGRADSLSSYRRIPNAVVDVRVELDVDSAVSNAERDLLKMSLPDKWSVMDFEFCLDMKSEYTIAGSVRIPRRRSRFTFQPQRIAEMLYLNLFQIKTHSQPKFSTVDE